MIIHSVVVSDFADLVVMFVDERLEAVEDFEVDESPGIVGNFAFAVH